MISLWHVDTGSFDNTIPPPFANVLIAASQSDNFTPLPIDSSTVPASDESSGRALHSHM